MKSKLYLTVQPHARDRYWITRILDGIADYAAPRHLSLVHTAARQIEAGQVLMIIGTTDRYLTEQAHICETQGGVPLLVNAHIPTALHGRSSVSFDLECAVRACVHCLEAQGCRRLLLVGINAHSGADRMKRRVFFSECHNRSLDAHEALCDSGRLCDLVDGALAVWQRGEADGILCANDTVALLLLSRIRASGMSASIPPMIGMGNSHLGRRATPSLTSIDFDYYLLGCEAAATYTFRAAAKSSHAFVKVLLPTKLICRETTRESYTPQTDSTAETAAGEDVYFSGRETETLLRLESCLQHLEPLACELIVSAGESYASLSQRLFLSERTLKYRMKHILTQLGIASKRELAQLVSSILSPVPDTERTVHDTN